ncbi:MAG: fasciclin domain-containing protein [Leptolyngbya sp. DLM2.Bin27]|nr:MAG: fasciclin domain-containing protein [Leptolyngbya sp. DLM2.Bin27]
MKRSSMAKRWMVGVAGVGAAALLAACGPANEPAADMTQDPTATEMPAADDGTAAQGGSVVDVAASEDDFSILVQAVEAAGLTETLSAGGPITLFAPTNAAFEALPDGTLDQLLLPENQDALRQILTYHVLEQEVPSSAVTTGEVPSAAGAPISLQVNDATGEVMVNQATVVQADIQASNGVIHAIDQVILPPDLAL